MEPPDSWDLLTSSLALLDLSQPRQAWSFLVVQGLVSDRGPERESFLGLVEKQMAGGPITGPSIARRVAGALAEAGIATPAAEVPDPWAETAAKRLESIALWGTEALGHESLDQIRKWRDRR